MPFNDIRSDVIEKEWVEFRNAVGLRFAGAIQQQEMLRAFFAGARSLLSAMMTVFDRASEPTPRDLLQMAAIQSELDRFLADLEQGRA